MENKITLSLNDSDLAILVHSLEVYTKEQRAIYENGIIQLNGSNTEQDVQKYQSRVKNARQEIERAGHIMKSCLDQAFKPIT
tara:strand:- start:229 stop:474 length:246 start_codon:yes stop_codon:yes gene_type:complete